jgi:hypothetical protein
LQKICAHYYLESPTENPEHAPAFSVVGKTREPEDEASSALKNRYEYLKYVVQTNILH